VFIVDGVSYLHVKVGARLRAHMHALANVHIAVGGTYKQAQRQLDRARYRYRCPPTLPSPTKKTNPPKNCAPQIGWRSPLGSLHARQRVALVRARVSEADLDDHQGERLRNEARRGGVGGGVDCRDQRAGGWGWAGGWTGGWARSSGNLGCGFLRLIEKRGAGALHRRRRRRRMQLGCVPAAAAAAAEQQQQRLSNPRVSSRG